MTQNIISAGAGATQAPHDALPAHTPAGASPFPQRDSAQAKIADRVAYQIPAPGNRGYMDDDALAEAAKTDAKACRECVASWRPFIGEIANKHFQFAAPHGVELEDLESAGMVGIMRAVRTYDRSRGSMRNLVSILTQEEMRKLYPRQDDDEHVGHPAPEAMQANEPGQTSALKRGEHGQRSPIQRNDPGPGQDFNFDTVRFFGQTTNSLAVELANTVTDPREREALARALTGESQSSIAKSFGVSRVRITQLLALARQEITAMLPKLGQAWRLLKPRPLRPGADPFTAPAYSICTDVLESERAWSFAKYFNPLARWVHDDRDKDAEPIAIEVAVNPDGTGAWSCDADKYTELAESVG